MKIDTNCILFQGYKIPDSQVDLSIFLNDYFRMYIDFCEEQNVNKTQINLLNDFRKNICACLAEYRCGQRSSAKYFFDLAMQTMNLNYICTALDSCELFRARRTKCDASEFRVLSKEEMFHIPFEKRYKVDNQRYSYPGLPCLYLGDSYEICCCELDDWNDNLNIALVKTNKGIRVLDLYFFKNYDFMNLSNEEFEMFISYWPIVFCCSLHYDDCDVLKFRQDYIVPQLLLEYIIDKNSRLFIAGRQDDIVGIRYHSVKSNLFEPYLPNTHSSCVNYVFPSQSDSCHGFCSVLQKYFYIESVCTLKELKSLSVS